MIHGLENRTRTNPASGPDAGQAPARRPLAHQFRRLPWNYFLLFALALSTRLVYQYARVGLSTPPVYDAAQYDELGWRLAQGQEYVLAGGDRSRRAPAFPFFLAAIYWLAGHSWPWARIGQAVLGASTCCFLYALGRSALGTLPGLAAALWFAVSPYDIFWSGELLSEPLCTLFVVASTLALVRVGDNRSSPVAWSILSGLATLTRPNLALLWLLGLPWVAKSGPRKLHKVALCVLVFTATLAPWTFRNYLAHGRLIFVTTMGGEVLWEANNPHVARDPELRGRSAHAADLPEAANVTGLPEADRDRAYFRMAARYVLHHPDELPLLLVTKLQRVWNVVPQVEKGLQRWVAIVHACAMVSLFAVGLWLGWRRRDQRLVPLLAPAIAVTLTALLYWGDARFRAPAEPTVLLIGTYGAVTLWRPRPRYSLEAQ